MFSRILFDKERPDLRFYFIFAINVNIWDLIFFFFCVHNLLFTDNWLFRKFSKGWLRNTRANQLGSRSRDYFFRYFNSTYKSTKWILSLSFTKIKLKRLLSGTFYLNKSNQLLKDRNTNTCVNERWTKKKTYFLGNILLGWWWPNFCQH